MPKHNPFAGRLVAFVGGKVGLWKVLSISPVHGESLPRVERVQIVQATLGSPNNAAWTLTGAMSHVRYVERGEERELAARQPRLGRPEATRAALIPVRKSPAWWALTQDERRAVFEERSHHIAEGLKYLPAIARQLLHSRDLGEPFDFLTWFEYAPADAEAFEELVHHLRQTEEWNYVDREVDIRLSL
jgi:chlorite dismutase